MQKNSKKNSSFLGLKFQSSKASKGNQLSPEKCKKETPSTYKQRISLISSIIYQPYPWYGVVLPTLDSKIHMSTNLHAVRTMFYIKSISSFNTANNIDKDNQNTNSPLKNIDPSGLQVNHRDFLIFLSLMSNWHCYYFSLKIRFLISVLQLT